MFKTIVIGIDGRSGGLDALELARTLAGADARLIAVHAYPLDLAVPRVPDYERALREEGQRVIDAIDSSDPRLTRIAIGDTSAARALHHTATAEHADLIVVGSCHLGSVGRTLVGDVSRNTLHGASCPVAIAPRDYRLDPPALRTVGVGFNDTAESTAALEAGAALAREFGAQLRTLTAVATPLPFEPGYAYSFDVPGVEERRRVEAQHALEAAIGHVGVPAEAEVVAGQPTEALVAMSKHADLIVAGSRGWGAVMRVVLGSTTDRLIHRAECPVLLVPSPARSETPTVSTREAVAS